MIWLLGFLGLTASAVIVALLWRFPVHTSLVCIGIAVGLDCLYPNKNGIYLGIWLYPNDIACAILLCAGGMALLRWRKLPLRSWWVVVALFVLVLVNLARGAAEFGVKAAGNGSRELTYLIVPAITLMLLRPAIRLDPARLATWLSLAGSALAVIALFRWVGILPMPEWSSQDTLREIPRVLPAEYAMVLGQATLALLYLQIDRGFSWRWAALAGTFAIELLFLQHRSVWAATAVGLSWLAIRTARSRRLAAGTATCILIALAMWSSVSPKAATGITGLLETNVQEIGGKDSTWSWRTAGFDEAIGRTFSAGATEMLIGPPAGRNLGSGASFASVSIHDRYVSTLAYYGLIGEAFLLVWLALIAKSAGGWVAFQPQQGRGYRAGRVFLQSLLLSQLTYFIPYTGGLPLGIAIGLVWAVAATRPTPRMPVRVFAYSRTLQTT